VVALLSTLIGTFAAYGIWRRADHVLSGSLYLSLVTPEIVTGVSLLAFFEWSFRFLRLRLGMHTVILAHTGFSLAYVVVVILANRRYRILDLELRRTGAGEMGPRANDMADLTRPGLDWVKLSEGHGVPAVRAATVADFAGRFREALRQSGPVLIEAVL